MNIADNSWIKLPRNFVNWSWYHDANMVQLYLYLLLNANVYDVKYNDITIKRGECLVSLNHLSKETGISLQKLRTGLARLQRTKEIEYKKLQNGRIIVLVDFNKFQPIGIDEAAPDWIKLYRKICDWGWYHEPNMVHLYVYFMLKAKLVINNDSRSEAWQLNSTLRLLTKATGISEKSIRTCLARLQRTGEISYLPGVAHKQSVITLCNYDSYQATKISTNTVLTQERHNNIESVSEHNNSQISAQKERDITRCNYDSYQATKISTNTVLTQEQHSSNTALTTLKEYKNKRIKEIKNIDDDIAHCAAHGTHELALCGGAALKVNAAQRAALCAHAQVVLTKDTGPRQSIPLGIPELGEAPSRITKIFVAQQQYAGKREFADSECGIRHGGIRRQLMIISSPNDPFLRNKQGLSATCRT